MVTMVVDIIADMVTDEIYGAILIFLVVAIIDTSVYVVP